MTNVILSSFRPAPLAAQPHPPHSKIPRDSKPINSLRDLFVNKQPHTVIHPAPLISPCCHNKDLSLKRADCERDMTFLYPWLSHNSLRQAYHAFDIDSPGDMPTRPILQVIKIGSSSVTMGRKKVATLKYPPFLFFRPCFSFWKC